MDSYDDSEKKKEKTNKGLMVNHKKNEINNFKYEFTYNEIFSVKNYVMN